MKIAAGFLAGTLSSAQAFALPLAVSGEFGYLGALLPSVLVLATVLCIHAGALVGNRPFGAIRPGGGLT